MQPFVECYVHKRSSNSNLNIIVQNFIINLIWLSWHLLRNSFESVCPNGLRISQNSRLNNLILMEKKNKQFDKSEWFIDEFNVNSKLVI